MKKTYRFTLPQNKEVENTNLRVENGEVIVDIELKERFEPKDGDFLVSSRGKVFIYTGLSTRIRYGAYCGVNSNNNIDICHPLSSGWTNKEGCRYATPEEKADFLKRLEGEKHLRWNAEKKCLEDTRWKPKKGESYFWVNGIGNINKSDNLTAIDLFRIMANNCFKTEDAAKIYADKFKEMLRKSKAE